MHVSINRIRCLFDIDDRHLSSYVSKLHKKLRNCNEILNKDIFHCIVLSHTNQSPVDINVVDIDQRFVYALPFFMNPKTEIS